MIDGDELLIDLMAGICAGVWLIAIPVIWRTRRREGRLPTAVVSAMVVAIASAAVGGALATIPYHMDLIDTQAARAIGAAWRAGMLTAGLYALGANARVPTRR